MSTVTVRWELSKAARQVSFVATGNEPGESYEFEIDLVDLTPAIRATLIEATKDSFASVVNLAKMPEFDDTYEDCEKPAYLTPTLYRDVEPTLTDVLNHADAVGEVEARIKVAVAEKKAVEKAERDRLNAIREEFLPQVEDLVASEDYEALGKLPPGLSIPGDGFVFSPRRGDSLSKIVDAARREIKKERSGREKAEWIEEHGSDHLKRAWFREHNCQRRYVIERAGVEAVTFTVDFDDRADWKDRSCPSVAALDLADRAEALDIGRVMIVWLTSPAQDTILTYEEEGWGDPFSATEAVIIREYLGRYDLVKIV